jgi:hypothetical protein
MTDQFMSVRPWDNEGRFCVVRWEGPDDEGFTSPVRIGPIYASETTAQQALTELQGKAADVIRLETNR